MSNRTFLKKFDRMTINGRIGACYTRARIMSWIAWVLPRELVYYCAVRVSMYSTIGEGRNCEYKDLKMMDAMWDWENRRWEQLTINE